MELRKLFPIMTGIVILLLAAVTLLGIKQYLLYRHCDEILSRSNQIIFQFTSIKEHLNDSLVTNTPINIQETSQELLGFEEDLKNIIDDILIPEEFKLSFISQVDLMGLVVQLRTIKDMRTPSAEQHAELTASLRAISNRLLGFHNLLSTYTRSLLLGLYKVIVGTLALIIFCTTSMLLLINRFIAIPIVKLCTITERHSEPDHNPFLTTSSLPASIQSLTSFITREQTYHTRMEHLQVCLNNVLQTLPDTFDSPDDWETVCGALQTNPDYFLVWVGQHTEKGNFPDPVTGCGCISSSPSQCKQAIEHLIEFCHQDGGLCDTARKAMNQGTQITALTTSEEMPKNLRNSLAIGNQPVLCASFPIVGPDHSIDTIITLYSTEEGSFGPLETSVLNFLCRHIGQIRTQLETDTTVAPAIPAELYRFSVAGDLAGSLAHEMINLVNGALNYSQALIDLTSDDQQQSDEYLLLEKLHTEEQKISRLAADFNMLANTEIKNPIKISAEQLVESTRRLVHARFRQHNVTLQTTIDKNIPDITAPVTLLQLVLLTLLHEAETFILSLPDNRRESIILKVSDQNHKELTITLSPLPSNIETKGKDIDEPWPSIALCHDIMENCEGALVITSGTDRSSLSATLSLPL
jgi:hypothetical protein